jgi:hypothetical protein
VRVGPGRRALAGLAVAIALGGCGSQLPAAVEALPEEVDGDALEDRSLAGDGRLAAALDDAGLAADAVAGHEARWGDDTRLVILAFEDLSLNDVSAVARSLLGIGAVESEIALVGDQAAFQLTGPQVSGVAYQFVPAGSSTESLMYTIVAPTVEAAEPIVDAIFEASQPQD